MSDYVESVTYRMSTPYEIVDEEGNYYDRIKIFDQASTLLESLI